MGTVDQLATAPAFGLVADEYDLRAGGPDRDIQSVGRSGASQARH